LLFIYPDRRWTYTVPTMDVEVTGGDSGNSGPMRDRPLPRESKNRAGRRVVRVAAESDRTKFRWVEP